MPAEIPWRRTADLIILARLEDILSIGIDSLIPAMLRQHWRVAPNRIAYLARGDDLVAMGWRDLTPAQQEVLVGRCRDGMSTSAIARQMRVSPGTVSRLQARALTILYQALADDDLLARVGPVGDRYHAIDRRGPDARIPFALRVAVYRRDGFICLHCGTGQALSIDHIHPFSKGGATVLENLQTLCRPCNSRKGARIPASV